MKQLEVETDGRKGKWIVEKEQKQEERKNKMRDLKVVQTGIRDYSVENRKCALRKSQEWY